MEQQQELLRTQTTLCAGPSVRVESDAITCAFGEAAPVQPRARVCRARKSCIMACLAMCSLTVTRCASCFPHPDAGDQQTVGVPAELKCCLTNNTSSTKQFIVVFAPGDAFLLAGPLSLQLSVLPYSSRAVR